jgi:hypothetical protein
LGLSLCPVKFASDEAHGTSQSTRVSSDVGSVASCHTEQQASPNDKNTAEEKGRRVEGCEFAKTTILRQFTYAASRLWKRMYSDKQIGIKRFKQRHFISFINHKTLNPSFKRMYH